MGGYSISYGLEFKNGENSLVRVLSGCTFNSCILAVTTITSRVSCSPHSGGEMSVCVDKAILASHMDIVVKILSRACFIFQKT